VIRTGIIGTGGMANSHARHFKTIKGCKVLACCDIVPGKAAQFAQTHNIPTAYEDTQEMLDKETLDAVSVVTPDRAHCEPSLMAIERGLHVMCEKPLSGNLKDARRMAQAARGKRVLTAVNFSYRNAAATQKAAQIVRSGRLGRIIHVEGCYLQSWLSSKVWGDWRKLPQLLWRLSIRHGSLGVLGDIGVHLYDLAGFVVGDFAEIACDLKTFDKGVRRVGEYVLDANDSFVSSVRFANGAIGTLHSSRWATGHQNTVALRVWGNDGALDLNLDRPGESQLRGCLGRKAVDKAAWKDIKCPPVPNMQQRFITSIKTGRQGQTSFEGAAVVQAYLEYSLRAAEKGGFVKIRV